MGPGHKQLSSGCSSLPHSVQRPDLYSHRLLLLTFHAPTVSHQPLDLEAKISKNLGLKRAPPFTQPLDGQDVVWPAIADRVVALTKQVRSQQKNERIRCCVSCRFKIVSSLRAVQRDCG